MKIDVEGHELSVVTSSVCSLQAIDLMKIDVEGHELSVVRSGATLFERKRGHVPPAYIISEFSPGAMDKLGYNPVRAIRLHTPLGCKRAYTPL